MNLSIPPSCRQGFTLIELSIVLVIIGLVVGGVLVGQDLIHAAEIRAQIGQIEKYNTAVNTFRIKYSYLPGDIPKDQAVQVGFTARTGVYGDGDGNGYINTINAAVMSFGLGGETMLFWNDLSSAGLVDGSFTAADTAININADSSLFAAYLPQAKIGRGAFVMAYGYGDNIAGTLLAAQNNYQIVIPSYNSTWSLNTAYVMTPTEVYSIDSKIDDGMPITGKVRFATQGTIDFAPNDWALPFYDPSTFPCILQSGSTVTYNTADPIIRDKIICGIRISADF